MAQAKSNAAGSNRTASKRTAAKKTTSGRKSDTVKRSQSHTGKKASKKSSSVKSSSKTQTKKKSAASGMKAEPTAGIGQEIAILVLFAVSVLILLSVLGFAGVAGGILRGVLFGLFGSLAYVFPFLLFFGGCFLISNSGGSRPAVWGRAIVSVLILVALCGILGLLGGRGLFREMTLPEYYEAGTAGLNGGLIGGVVFELLYPLLGVMGTYVVLVAIVIIGLVAVTGRSLLAPLSRGGNRVVNSAKADLDRRRERKREEDLTEDGENSRDQKDSNRKNIREQSRRQVDHRNQANNKEEEANNKEEEMGSSRTHSRKGGKRTDQKVQGVSLRDTDLGEEAITVADPDPFSEVSVPEPREESLLRPDVITDAGLKTNLPETDLLKKDLMEEVREEKILVPEFPEDRWLTDVTEDTAASEIPWGEPEAELPEDVPPEASAMQQQSEEETDPMAAYDAFDSPHPEAVMRQTGEAGSIWRQGEKKDGSSGITFHSEKRSSLDKDVVPVVPATPEVKKEYVLPPIRLLKAPPKRTTARKAELRRTAAKLQQTLQNFGVGVTVTDISCGPAVTRYELQPEQGVKVSRIVNLADDIKLNLAASDIRIEAPIPGKAAVGIEVPNEENQTVYLRELLDSEEFRKSPSKVSFGVGRDISGKVVVSDLARMPHLLIAGATGSGKSVCINTLIMAILYKARPDEVKLIMIDPKVVELSAYNGIPHLMIPVVTDPKKAAGALNWAVAEMTDRYQRFAEADVRDIAGYNRKAEADPDGGLEKMCQIVVIVDELADLMMVAAGEVEEAICRLAQLARAAGIHLVLATQRPSVNVITGLIKANVPSRIAFAVSSGVDSRTIIDMVGAEKLLGKGDMLFYPTGYPKPVRVQGAFVSDEEVRTVVDYLKSQTEGNVSLNQALVQRLEQKMDPQDSGSVGRVPRDAYFERCGRFIIEKDKASIGNLQRAFRVGFNRAARIMDQLAEAGVVGPEDGTKPREILMTMEEFEEMLKQDRVQEV